MPYKGTLHLFAILSDPDENDTVLAVMVTSIKAGRPHDGTCVLDVGDHRFIRHPSYIAYSIAETPRVLHIHNMIGKNYFVCDEDFEEAVIERITTGLFDSDETKDRLINYANDLKL